MVKAINERFFKFRNTKEVKRIAQLTFPYSRMRSTLNMQFLPDQEGANN